MGRLIIHGDPDPEKLERERAERFLQLSPQEKFEALCTLIDLAVKLNNGRPLKQPQGKGIIIRKPIQANGYTTR